MDAPYYFKIKNSEEYLEHYQRIYEGHYNKQRAKQVVSLFPNLGGAKILEIGCGGGFYSMVASQRHPKFQISSDFTPICVKAVKANLKKNGVENSEALISDALHLPFKDESFDFIICIDLIEHISDDAGLLAEVKRIIRSPGALVLATQNSYSLNYLLEAFLQRCILKNSGWMGWDTTHIRFYNPKKLKVLLQKFDFTIINYAGTYFVPYFFGSYLDRVNKKLSESTYIVLMKINKQFEGSVFKKFGWGIICLCVKNMKLKS